MSTRLDLIQPTVGWEGEIHDIGFIVVRQRQITTHAESRALSIIGPTTANKIQCVNDEINTNFSKTIESIAQNTKYSIAGPLSYFHVFEFFTPPTTNTADIKNQFDEIGKIEVDLIKYILDRKKSNRNIELISVKDWLNSYNKRNNNSLPLTNDADDLFIMANMSIKQLNMSDAEIKLWQESEDLTELAQAIQARLKHYVQYNFVSSLGRNMGSMLLDVFNENNMLHSLQQETKQLQDQFKLDLAEAKKRGMSDNEINIASNPMKNYLADKERDIQIGLKKLDILREAQANATIACNYVRGLQYHNPTDARKLIKLEGLFFILSTRIITETSYLPIPRGTSAKEKYFFLLKSKLSNLIYCLSENDRNLLKEIRDTWKEEDKNQLLAYIAGSAEALTVRFKKDNDHFTAKQVIESALGWGVKTKTLVCDLLPNTNDKSRATAFEPTTPGLHHKEHKSLDRDEPIERIIFENRASKKHTLLESRQEMELTLQRSAMFSKTTHLHKLDGVYLNEDQERKSFEFKDPIHDNVNKIINIILAPEFNNENLKNVLTEMLFSQDRDTLIKQINYLFIKIHDPLNISRNNLHVINQTLLEIYSETLVNLFPFPVKADDSLYISYLLNRYSINEKSPHMAEYLKFCANFSDKNTFEFKPILRNINQVWTMDYAITNSAKINQIDKDGYTALNYACHYGLNHLVNVLLNAKATPSDTDMSLAFKSGILTSNLAMRLMDAGADSIKCLGYLAGEKDTAPIKKISEFIGKDKLKQAIDHYANNEAIFTVLTKAKDEMEVSHQYSSSHSVLFPANETKEHEIELITLTAFKNSLLGILSEHPEKYKATITTLLETKDALSEDKVYQLLVNINDLIKPEDKIRERINSTLDDMLKKLSVPDDKNLQKDFVSIKPATKSGPQV